MIRLVKAIASAIAKLLLKFDNDQQFKYYELEFGLRSLVNFWSIIILSLLISLLLNNFGETLITMVSLSLLRKLTGGQHFKSSERCILYSVSLFVLIPYIIDLFTKYIGFVNILDLTLVAALAPLNTYNDKHTMIRYKLASLLLVSLNVFVCQNPIISVAFLAQSINLINFSGGIENG